MYEILSTDFNILQDFISRNNDDGKQGYIYIYDFSPMRKKGTKAIEAINRK